jgi:hypothetical protein
MTSISFSGKSIITDISPSILLVMCPSGKSIVETMSDFIYCHSKCDY